MGSQQSKHQSGFERLPLEVRQEIYGYLGYPVVEDQVIHCEKFVKVFIPVRERHWFVDGTGRHAHNYLKISDSMIRLKHCPALLQVNKAISAELYEILYSQTMFNFLFDVSRDLSFLTSRALAYLTHVTIGPLAHSLIHGNAVRWVDDARVQALTGSIKFVCQNCPRLEVLGVHVISGDFIDFYGLPYNRLQPVIDALYDAAALCRKLKRIIIGLGKLPFETVELASLPEVNREEEVEDWAMTVFACIQTMIHDQLEPEHTALGRLEMMAARDDDDTADDEDDTEDEGGGEHLADDTVNNSSAIGDDTADHEDDTEGEGGREDRTDDAVDNPAESAEHDSGR